MLNSEKTQNLSQEDLAVLAETKAICRELELDSNADVETMLTEMLGIVSVPGCPF